MEPAGSGATWTLAARAVRIGRAESMRVGRSEDSNDMQDVNVQRVAAPSIARLNRSRRMPIGVELIGLCRPQRPNNRASSRG